MAIRRQYVTFRFTYDETVLRRPSDLIRGRGNRVFSKDSVLVKTAHENGGFSVEVVTTSRATKVEEHE